MKLDLKQGETYSQKQIAEIMGIKPNTFTKKREEYQTHLLNFCEYELDYSSKPFKYHIIEVYDIEYFKRGKRNEKFAVIEKALLEENHKQHISTAARGARKIAKQPEVQELGLADTTLYVYSSVITVKLYGKRDGSVKSGTHGWIDHEVLVYWDRVLDEYVLLTDDQIDEYFGYISDEHASSISEMTKIFDRFTERKRTKTECDEFNKQLAGIDARIFINAKTRFKEKYGGTPFWACYYKHFDEDTIGVISLEEV